MDSKKIMAEILGGIEKQQPQLVKKDDIQTAVEELAEMVVAYERELKKQGVGYFVRRSLLVAFQTQTLGVALILNSGAAGPN
jgi:hypothetical protein